MCGKERSDFRALASALFSSSWRLAICNSFAAWLSGDEDEDESESEGASWNALSFCPRWLAASTLVLRDDLGTLGPTLRLPQVGQKLTLTLDSAHHVGKAGFRKW